MASRTRTRRGAQDQNASGSTATPEKIAALRVERLTIASLQDSYHPRNSEIRNHPLPDTPRWNALRRSLAHDYFDPIVLNVRNGFLVSGHLRLKLLTEMNFTHVDVSIVDYDEPTHIARMLAANRGFGEDNEAGQKEFLQELEDCTDFDFALAGFTDDEAAKMFEWEDTSHISENGSSNHASENGDNDGDFSNESGAASRWELVIAIQSQSELEALYNELSERGLTCRILTL